MIQLPSYYLAFLVILICNPLSAIDSVYGVLNSKHTVAEARKNLKHKKIVALLTTIFPVLDIFFPGQVAPSTMQILTEILIFSVGGFYTFFSMRRLDNVLEIISKRVI